MAVIRKIDELGRIVIPMTYRSQLDIKHNDRLIMKLTENEIVVSKYDASFNVEDFIVNFVINTYGSSYQDILVSKTMKKDVYKMLKHYFDIKLSKKKGKRNE